MHDVDGGEMFRSTNGVFQTIRKIRIVATRVLLQAVCVQQQDVTAPHQRPLVNFVWLFEAQYALAPVPVDNALGRKRTKGWKRDALLTVHFHETVVCSREDDGRRMARQKKTKRSILRDLTVDSRDELVHLRRAVKPLVQV